MKIRERTLRRAVRDELRDAGGARRRLLSEQFSPEERDALSSIIRSEIADLFYDLFRKRSFWVD